MTLIPKPMKGEILKVARRWDLSEFLFYGIGIGKFAFGIIRMKKRPHKKRKP